MTALAHGVPVESFMDKPYSPEFLKSARDRGINPQDPNTKFNTVFDFMQMYPEGVKQKSQYTAITFDLLKQMASHCAPVAGVIRTRANQVAAYGKAQDNRNEAGFKIRLRDKRKSPSTAAEEKIYQLQLGIERCGLVDPDPRLREHTFDHFLRILTRDSLRYDAMAFEVRPGRNSTRYPAVRWQAVDATQIRFVEPDLFETKHGDGPQGLPYVYCQWRDEKVIAEYTDNELAYGIRTPSVDPKTMGYGTSELEELIDIVSSFVFGISYNKNYFTQNSVPPGILALQGNFSENTIKAFRQNWEMQLKGVQNIWRTPIIGVPDGGGVNYIPFRQSARDMEYHQWMMFLTAWVCAIFQIDPTELGFSPYSTKASSIGSEASPTSRLQHSEDKGLIPLLASIASLINAKIIWQIDPDFIFEWVGLKQYDAMAEAQLFQIRLGTVNTVNEIRSEMDLKPLKSDSGEYDTVLNPMVVQLINSGKQEEMQQQMQAQGMAGMGGQMPQMAGGNSDPSGEGDSESVGKLMEHQGADDTDAPELKQAMMQRVAQQHQQQGQPMNPAMQQGQMLKRSLADGPMIGDGLGDYTWIKSLAVSEAIAEKLSSEGCILVDDLSSMTLTELGMVLEGSERRELVKALRDAGYTISEAFDDSGALALQKSEM
jgi:hypothetical protein